MASPGEYIHRFGGKRAIEKVLVANNGIGAVKFMRSIRRWAYEAFGNEKVIRFHVMVTPEDMKVSRVELSYCVSEKEMRLLISITMMIPYLITFIFFHVHIHLFPRGPLNCHDFIANIAILYLFSHSHGNIPLSHNC